MNLIVYSAAGQQIFEILSLTTHHHLFAYIDPGTGSFIIQIIIASFVGCTFAIKLFWGRIKIFVKKLFGGKGETPEQ